MISPHLYIYFNIFFSKGIFPDCLKTGYIVPIFKSGNSTLASNYRPIVILNTLSKVFESLVLDGLEFELKHLVVPQQHGFRSGRSTTTNLTIFQHYITSAFARGRQVDCIYLDFAKAFDRVSHKHLLAKLDSLGFSSSLLQFFQSYLRGRTLSVRCGTAISHPIGAESGVPQGSHLGPFLFNLFINDIGDALTAKHLLFADDVKLFLESSSGHDVDRLRSSLRAVEHWCFKNAMDLNVSKCSVMTFSRSRNPVFHDYYLGSEILHRVWKMKDLGVITTSTLHPDEHVRFICRRANSTLGFIFRFSGGLHSDSLVTLYKTLVRPLLEYNSSVWAPYQSTLISDIERVQVRFIRVVGCRMGYNYLEVPVPLLKSHFRLHDLDIRRRIHDSVLLMKLINGVVGCPELLQELPFHTPGRTRSQDLFERLQYSTLYQQRSTLPRLLQLGNEIGGSVDFFSPGVARFRSQAVRLLTANDGVGDE